MSKPKPLTPAMQATLDRMKPGRWYSAGELNCPEADPTLFAMESRGIVQARFSTSRHLIEYIKPAAPENPAP